MNPVYMCSRVSHFRVIIPNHSASPKDECIRYKKNIGFICFTPIPPLDLTLQVSPEMLIRIKHLDTLTLGHLGTWWNEETGETREFFI